MNIGKPLRTIHIPERERKQPIPAPNWPQRIENPETIPVPNWPEPERIDTEKEAA